jgi:hypothetical protein
MGGRVGRGARFMTFVFVGGTGFGECANKTQPPRKLKTLAMAIQTRSAFIYVFI